MSKRCARLVDLTPEEYLADASWFRGPSLNASTAHLMVAESPLHAYTQHPRLGGADAARRPAVGTKPMNDGALIHKLMLGKGRDVIPIPSQDYRTVAAREARAEIAAAGKIPVLERDYQEKIAIAARLRDRCAAMGIVFDGMSEACLEWCERYDNRLIRCRAMLDHLDLARGEILELKTGRSVNPDAIARRFVECGYDISHAAYTRALAAYEPEFEGRVNFVFLFVELQPPYSIVPCRPDGALRTIGAARWERAVRLWTECLESGVWPGYTGADGGVATLEAPRWEIARELGDAPIDEWDIDYGARIAPEVAAS
jgi:hypothetical protein